MQPPHPRRVAGLRLPDLPPRDLERLAAVGTGPHSAPAPDSATYALPPPVATPTKFACDGSPADVRGYAPTVNPLLMRGGVVSPGAGGGSGLVLPNLSLPLSGAPPSTSNTPSTTLPAVLHSASASTSSIAAPPAPPTLRALVPPPRAAGSAGSGSAGAGGSSSGMIVMSPPVSSMAPVSAPPLPRSGARTAPSSPVTAGMSQNEIKKAQNRKSAKRFREAQKQRWKNMADDLMIQKRTIDELRAQVAAQAHANSALRAHTLRCQEGKRSAVSIHDLVDNDGATAATAGSHAEAEAALYAQILSNTAKKSSDPNCPDPYVKDLGKLEVCFVVASTDSRIVSVRRGQRKGIGAFATEALPPADMKEFRNALQCGSPVSISVTRNGSRVNCVMNPVEGSDRVVVAEFTPFQ